VPLPPAARSTPREPPLSSTTKTPPAGEANLGHIIFIAAAAAMGGFLFGYDSSVISGAVTGIQHHFKVGNGETALVVSSALLGSAVGAACAGTMADRIGRIKVMQIAGILFAISGAGSMFPPNMWILGTWRVIGGLAIGMASVIAPAYIAEVAPAAVRGRLASFQQAAIVLGIFISQLVNYALNEGAGGNPNDHIAGIHCQAWMPAATPTTTSPASRPGSGCSGWRPSRRSSTS
jgi:SP family sugar:H+ symporter-like MFS transporter